MTAEQAPGIPWHDHDWVDVTRMGEKQRHYMCAFDPRYEARGIRVPASSTRCPAERWEPYPEVLLDGLRVYDCAGNFLRYASGGSVLLPQGTARLDDETPEDCRVEVIQQGIVVAVGRVQVAPTANFDWD